MSVGLHIAHSSALTIFSVSLNPVGRSTFLSIYNTSHFNITYPSITLEHPSISIPTHLPAVPPAPPPTHRHGLLQCFAVQFEILLLDVCQVVLGSADDQPDQVVISGAHPLHGVVQSLGEVGGPVEGALHCGEGGG